MADDYKIKIGTEADVSGAKATEQALDKVGEAAKGAEKAAEALNEEQAAGAKAGKDLSKSIQEVSAGATGAQQLMGGLGKILSGNVLGGVKDCTTAMRGLNTVMAANPAGRLVAVFSALVGVWTMVSRAIKGASDAAEEASDRSEDLKTGMEGAGTAAQKLSEQIGAYEKLAEAMKRTADEAERFRKIHDEFTDANVALDLANTDLAEASGDITPDEARAKRAGIRVEGQRAKSQTAISTAEAERERALAQIAAAKETTSSTSAEAAAAKAHFEQVTQEALKHGAPLDVARASEEDFAAARAEGAKRLRDAESTVQHGRTPDTSKAEQIAKAQAQVDWIDETASAFARMQEAAKAAKDALDAEAKVTAEGSAVIAERTWKIELEKSKAQAAEKSATTEQLRHIKDVNEAKKAETEKFFREAPDAVANVQELSRLDQAAVEANIPKTPDQLRRERDEDERADVTKNAERIGKEAGGLSARSPESINRLRQAAADLKEGAPTEGAADQLAQALDEVATALERVGKDASKQRELEKEVRNLKAQVQRLNRQQGQ